VGRQPRVRFRRPTACVAMLELEADQLAQQWRHQSTRSLGILKSTFEALAAIEGRKEMVSSPGAGPAQRRPPGHQRRPLLAPEAAAASRVALHREGRGQLRRLLRLLPLHSASGRTPTPSPLARRLHEPGQRDRPLRHAEWPSPASPRGLGLLPPGLRADGEAAQRQVHRLSVHVERPDVTVRAHSRTTIARPAPPRGREGPRGAPRGAARGHLAAVRAATWTLGDPAADRVRILVGRNRAGRGPRGDHRRLRPPRRLLAGREELHPELRAPRRLRPAALLATLSVPPGTYTLRLGAATARSAGSVEHTVKATLTRAGGLSVGDLLVGPVPSRVRLPPAARPRAGPGPSWPTSSWSRPTPPPWPGGGRRGGGPRRERPRPLRGAGAARGREGARAEGRPGEAGHGRPPSRCLLVPGASERRRPRGGGGHGGAPGRRPGGLAVRWAVASSASSWPLRGTVPRRGRAGAGRGGWPAGPALRAARRALPPRRADQAVSGLDGWRKATSRPRPAACGATPRSATGSSSRP